MINYRHRSRHCAPPYTRSLMHPVVLLAEENTLQITTTLRYTSNLPRDNIWSPKTFLVLILGTYKLCNPGRFNWASHLFPKTDLHPSRKFEFDNSTPAFRNNISFSLHLSTSNSKHPRNANSPCDFSAPRLASRGRSNSGDSMPGISAKGHACSKTWLM